MKDYKLVTGINKLQEASKEGYVFVSIINPHEWLVGKENVDLGGEGEPFVIENKEDYLGAVRKISEKAVMGKLIEELPNPTLVERVNKSKNERATDKKDS